MSDRTGDWLQTFTGRCFWPLDPRPEEICIEDIAHALSMRCRYAGHTTRFYSVAEHSALVSRHVAPGHALWGLLHDAAEAYSSDIPRPLKADLREWKAIEERIMRAVCLRFGLDPSEPAAVKSIDLAITADERAALMAPCERDWGELPPPIGADIQGRSPAEAESMFLHRFAELTGTKVDDAAGSLITEGLLNLATGIYLQCQGSVRDCMRVTLTSIIPPMIARQKALIEAVQKWCADIEGEPDGPSDARLLKALWTYDGDRTEPSCDDCDGECDEPCGPCTVAEAHAELDRFIERWMARNSGSPPATPRPGARRL